MLRLSLIALVFSCFSWSVYAQTGVKGKLIVEEEEGIKEMQDAYIKEEKKLEGYRVQIYNGRRDACMTQRSLFKKYYPSVNVHTLYEAPEYRVQAGDFRTKLEAEKFLISLDDQFKGSFVVKTNIELPPLLPKE